MNFYKQVFKDIWSRPNYLICKYSSTTTVSTTENPKKVGRPRVRNSPAPKKQLNFDSYFGKKRAILIEKLPFKSTRRKKIFPENPYLVGDGKEF